MVAPARRYREKATPTEGAKVATKAARAEAKNGISKLAKSQGKTRGTPEPAAAKQKVPKSKAEGFAGLDLRLEEDKKKNNQKEMSVDEKLKLIAQAKTLQKRTKSYEKDGKAQECSKRNGKARDSSNREQPSKTKSDQREKSIAKPTSAKQVKKQTEKSQPSKVAQKAPEGVCTPPLKRSKTASSMGNSEVREMAALLAESQSDDDDDDEEGQGSGDEQEDDEEEAADEGVAEVEEEDDVAENDVEEGSDDEEDEEGEEGEEGEECEEGEEGEGDDDNEAEEEASQDNDEDDMEKESGDESVPNKNALALAEVISKTQSGEPAATSKLRNSALSIQFRSVFFFSVGLFWGIGLWQTVYKLSISPTWQFWGTTNKKEWDKFVRSKERFRVHDYFQANKVELFNFWLDSNQSWDACQLHVQRSQEHENESKRGWVSVQGRDIRAKYPEAKAKQLMDARKADGMYYEDPDFPGDDDDSWLCW